MSDERLTKPSPPGWRPIETAPQNVEVLIAVYRDDFEDPIIANSILLDGEERGWYWSDWHGMPAPTHWQPLPSPPGAEGQGEDSALSPRDEPSDELVKAVRKALFDELKRHDELDQVPGAQAAQDALTALARAAIEAYQKTTVGDPRGEADTLPSAQEIERLRRIIATKVAEWRERTLASRGSDSSAYHSCGGYDALCELEAALQPQAEKERTDG